MHPKSPPVLAAKGSRNVHDVSNHSDKGNQTVLVTGSASGELVPVLMLYSFERIPTVMSANAPPDWALGNLSSGWMTCESFFEYIANVFNKYLVDNNIPKPVALFVDGHKRHRYRYHCNLANFAETMV